MLVCLKTNLRKFCLAQWCITKVTIIKLNTAYIHDMKNEMSKQETSQEHTLEHKNLKHWQVTSIKTTRIEKSKEVEERTWCEVNYLPDPWAGQVKWLQSIQVRQYPLLLWFSTDKILNAQLLKPSHSLLDWELQWYYTLCSPGL